jgi:hypothetical protein
MNRLHPAFEEVVNRAFLPVPSRRKEFNQLIQDLVATAEEINKDGGTRENRKLFDTAQKKLLYFILIHQDHYVFE